MLMTAPGLSLTTIRIHQLRVNDLACCKSSQCNSGYIHTSHSFYGQLAKRRHAYMAIHLTSVRTGR